MIDGNLLRLVAAAGNVVADDVVIEVGPGTGSLTEELLATGCRVAAVEIDRNLAGLLRQRLGTNERFTLIEGDALSGKHALNVELLAVIQSARSQGRIVKLVANLPYSVASPILVELAQSPRRPERMVTTLQLEVAQRLMARADDDDYGVLTLLVQLDYEPRDSFKIPADCFFPAPNVDSMCVVLQRRARPLLADGQRAAFVKIVKRAFSQRRKMMLKLLKQDWAADKLAVAFTELRISPQERAEKLSLEQFVALTKILTAEK